MICRKSTNLSPDEPKSKSCHMFTHTGRCGHVLECSQASESSTRMIQLSQSRLHLFSWRKTSVTGFLHRLARAALSAGCRGFVIAITCIHHPDLAGPQARVPGLSPAQPSRFDQPRSHSRTMPLDLGRTPIKRFASSTTTKTLNMSFILPFWSTAQL